VPLTAGRGGLHLFLCKGTELWHNRSRGCQHRQGVCRPLRDVLAHHRRARRGPDRASVFVGVDGITLCYRGARGRRVAEVFHFGADGQVIRAHAYYAD
jgi:hypothetical protein